MKLKRWTTPHHFLVMMIAAVVDLIEIAFIFNEISWQKLRNL